MIPDLIAERVCDTNIVSFLFKSDSRAQLYRPHLVGRLPIISFMTVAELDYWSLRRGWGERRRSELQQFPGQFIVHHSSSDLCRWWSVVMDGARRRGRAIEVADARVAATALLYDVPLVTHDPDDFAGVDGLQIITEPEP